MPSTCRRERFWYAHTKVKAEEAVAEFAADGLDVVTLNPTVIIGPGDINAISGSFILETARLQWLVPMSSGGLAVIDVRDVARAHVNALDRGRSGERYILNSANLSYRQWFGLIAAACDVRAPLFALPDWTLEPTARLIELLRALGMQTPMDANQTRLGGTHVYFDGRKAYAELFTPAIDIETSLPGNFQVVSAEWLYQARLADPPHRFDLARGRPLYQILKQRLRPLQHAFGMELYAEN